MDFPVKRTALAVLVAVSVLAAGAEPSTGGAARPRRAFVPVLIYHHVKWLKPSDDAIERGLTVLPTQFASELSYLTSAGYHTITAADLVSFLRGGKNLPARPVVLTFDDGYTDVFQGVYAQLLRRHMRATFFIVPGFLNTPRYLSWKQVEAMAAHGMDVEAHSMSHPDLTIVGPAQLSHEVSASRQELQTRLHRAVRVFAYPYGAFDAQVEAALTRAGFIASFTTQQGWWQSAAQLLTLPRVYVDIDDTPAIFRGRLADSPTVLARDPT
jgi:peptidoglycan/xylan/chitin deacetylase (PgdA/CDA1 family)